MGKQTEGAGGGEGFKFERDRKTHAFNESAMAAGLGAIV